MKRTGNWDDPNERGKKDRIWLSRTEYWEMSYFIEQYIKTRGWPDNEKNREAFRAGINGYTGSAPIKREDMDKYLDAKWPPPNKPK